MNKDTVGIKHDQGKPRYSLLPEHALPAIVSVLECGAAKYGVDNWRHVENTHDRYYNAAMRHIQAWWQGEQLDQETDLPHLAHAASCLMFLLSLEHSPDILTPPPPTDILTAATHLADMYPTGTVFYSTDTQRIILIRTIAQTDETVTAHFDAELSQIGREVSHRFITDVIWRYEDDNQWTRVK